MRYLGWIAGAVVAIAAVAFAAHNYETQRLDLWPFPFVVELPLYALVLAAVAVGFCFGAILMWISEGRWRRLARRRGRQLRSLTKELEALKKRTEGEAADVSLPAPAEPVRQEKRAAP